MVCIEIHITRLEGRLKASQDEALADREGTVRGLRSSGSATGAAMADWVDNALHQPPAA